jgi:hypothetical protein
MGFLTTVFEVLDFDPSVQSGRPEISCLLDPYNTLVFPQAVWREVRADVTQEETAWPPSV